MKPELCEYSFLKISQEELKKFLLEISIPEDQIPMNIKELHIRAQREFGGQVEFELQISSKPTY